MSSRAAELPDSSSQPATSSPTSMRTGASQWLSRPGGAGWNVARCGRAARPADRLRRLARRRQLLRRAVERERRRRSRHALHAARRAAAAARDRPSDAAAAYFFMGENGADLAFDPSKLPQGWMEQVKWAHFGCISLVRQPLGETLAALGRAIARARREDQLRSELSQSDGAPATSRPAQHGRARRPDQGIGRRLAPAVRDRREADALAQIARDESAGDACSSRADREAAL